MIRRLTEMVAAGKTIALKNTASVREVAGYPRLVTNISSDRGKNATTPPVVPAIESNGIQA